MENEVKTICVFEKVKIMCVYIYRYRYMYMSYSQCFPYSYITEHQMEKNRGHDMDTGIAQRIMFSLDWNIEPNLLYSL